jgi:histone-binding protein RBBP4
LVRIIYVSYFSIEIGGYGAFNDAQIHITQKIVHEGEVNRARYQYENPNIIASKSRSGDVYVFDRTTHESFPKENEPFNPALRLKGHTAEG